MYEGNRMSDDSNGAGDYGYEGIHMGDDSNRAGDYGYEGIHTDEAGMELEYTDGGEDEY